MSKSVCCPSNIISPENGQCSNRFEVMDELNRHYSERIDKIEKTGCTELVISNLKKWIEALVTHDKVLISTIESLESEALARSEKITQLCKERLEVEDICQKYKKELSEKTDLIKDLSRKTKEQSETIQKNECVIKRLNEELDYLKNLLECLEEKKACAESELCEMKVKIECLKKELLSRDRKVKSLEDQVGSFKRGMATLKDQKSSEEGELGDMNAKIESLTKELSCKEREVKSLEDQLGDCQTTMDELKEQKNAESQCDSDQVKDLINQLNEWELKIAIKDEKLKEHSSRIQLLQSKLESKCEEDIKEKLIESQRDIERLQKLLDEMKSSSESNVETLKRNIENLKRESRDMKEALTAEVAEKHDIITTLRRDTAQLEEKARQADMQAIFKDDIIKELRKEVKLARAKESFVEMLGLNEGSRVQMKSKIDSLSAELEEKQAEVDSLENKLEEMNRHALEGKLGELSLQLMDRERDMIILCNKVDYIKRYLDKLHDDEDISIKCGLKALLLELNEETEWRRKARRSVTSLGDQPESVIIINRSNSLPAEPSEHVRYNGRVNELELKLERAREEICGLRKKLETKESELACLEKYDQSEDLNRVDKVLLPDSMLSLKLEEFQRFTNESGKKLQETIDEIKQHAGNLLLKEDMEELGLFLNSEQETFFKANRQLHVLLCNIKNSTQGLSTPANYKLQCLENKLKSALETIDKGKINDTSCRSEQEQSNKFLLENMQGKIKDSLKIVCDLKQDAPQAADSVDPLSTAGSTKLIQEVQEMIQIIQNQSKIQQSRLFAILDNQKEETGSLTKKFSEVDCLLRSHCTSINYVKDELKIALCNITQKAEKVRKQAENMSQFEGSVKEISNWINSNLKNNSEVINKVNNLLMNLEQLKCMNSSIEDSRKEAQNCHESNETDLNEFEDKCLIARDLCDEVNRELERAASRINEREHKLTQLSKDISCFGETICRLQGEIVRTAHVMSGEGGECSDEDTSYEEAAANLQNSNKQLLQALHNMKHKLIAHNREADNYDIKGIESRKTIAGRLKELDESLNELSNILGELKAKEYIESTRALSTGSVRGMNIQDMEGSTCAKNQTAASNSLIQELKNEIRYLNESISTLEKQNNCHQKTIETLKCQLAKTKEEADKALKNMVSNLQEKCQSLEPLSVSKENTPESTQPARKPWVSWIYRQKQNPNQVHEV